LSDDFSFIHKKSGPILFGATYPIGRIFFCDEISEVGFYLLNTYSSRETEIEIIREFIDFIRENEIIFLGEDKQEDDQ
jgi:hypothetical protein